AVARDGRQHKSCSLTTINAEPAELAEQGLSASSALYVASPKEIRNVRGVPSRQHVTGREKSAISCNECRAFTRRSSRLTSSRTAEFLILRKFARYDGRT